MDVAPSTERTFVTARRYRSGHDRGLTLIELTVALAVVAVLLGLAIPSFRNLVADSRRAAHLNQLVTSLNLARGEAIKRRTDMLLCKSVDGKLCDKSGQWQDGWIIYPDQDGSRKRENNETLVARQGILSDCTLRFGAFTGAGNYVLYRPNGFSLTNGTFVHCDERGTESARAIIISPTGRIRISDTYASGDPLTCP